MKRRRESAGVVPETKRRRESARRVVTNDCFLLLPCGLLALAL